MAPGANPGQLETASPYPRVSRTPAPLALFLKLSVRPRDILRREDKLLVTANPKLHPSWRCPHGVANNEAHPAIWAPFSLVGEGGSPPTAEAPITSPPVTGALSAGSTKPVPDNAAAPATEGKQTTKTEPGTRKKARAKPKPDDWITSIFGQ
jgi:hypothetical protein